MIPRVHIADEGFKSVSNKFDRAAEHPAERNRRQLITIDVKFDTETAADIGADHPYLMFVDSEVPGEHILLLPGCLMRGINRQRFITGIPVCYRRSRLQRNTCMSAERKFCCYSCSISGDTLSSRYRRFEC